MFLVNTAATRARLGLHGYSGVKDYSMGSVTRKVLDHAEDMAVCIVP
jgi:hypothetical protein